MKKKLALSIAAAAMVGTLAVGGTLAWFTDTETATNVVTMGNVNISILESETGVEGSYTTQDGAGLVFDEKFVPNATIGKYVKIENTGENSAYIRVKVNVEGLGADKELGLNYNTTDWTKEGDYYYYNDKVEVGGDTEVLFSEVTVPSDLGNDYTGDSISIIINAEAIQADNSGNTAQAAFGNIEGQVPDFEDSTSVDEAE